MGKIIGKLFSCAATKPFERKRLKCSCDCPPQYVFFYYCFDMKSKLAATPGNKILTKEQLYWKMNM